MPICPCKLGCFAVMAIKTCGPKFSLSPSCLLNVSQRYTQQMANLMDSGLWHLSEVWNKGGIFYFHPEAGHTCFFFDFAIGGKNGCCIQNWYHSCLVQTRRYFALFGEIFGQFYSKTLGQTLSKVCTVELPKNIHETCHFLFVHSWNLPYPIGWMYGIFALPIYQKKRNQPYR